MIDEVLDNVHRASFLEIFLVEKCKQALIHHSSLHGNLLPCCCAMDGMKYQRCSSQCTRPLQFFFA